MILPVLRRMVLALIAWSARKGLLGLCSAFGLAVMVACGGKGGASDPGLTIAPTSISFTAHQGDATPAPQAVQITVTNASAAYIGAQWVGSAPTWVDGTGITGSGQDWSLGLQIGSTSLDPGTYSAELKIGIADSNGNVLATRNATITYRLYGSFQVTPNSLSVMFIQGQAAPAGQTLSLTGTAGNWTATADQSWIHLNGASGTTPGSLTASVDPTGLAVGAHAVTAVYSGSGAFASSQT